MKKPIQARTLKTALVFVVLFGMFISNGVAAQADITKLGSDAVIKVEAQSTQPSTTWINPFSDVRETDWFYDYVAFVCENGLMNGMSDTTFSPNMTMTRAMVATILYRMAGQPETTGLTNPYSDLEENYWYVEAIIWLANGGIVPGNSSDTFSPNDVATRQDLNVFLARYALITGLDLPETRDYQEFADEEDIAAWAKDSIVLCFRAELTYGYPDNRFNPNGVFTRAEYAAVLYRLALIYQKTDDIYWLTYDAQGGSPTPPPQMVLRGESASVSYSLPIRLGYTFMGWCANPSGNGEYLQRGYGFMPDSDMQLYAIWQWDEYYYLSGITSPGTESGYFADPVGGISPFLGSLSTLEAYRNTRYQAYSVWLNYGQEVTVYMESNDFDSYLYMLDPDGYYITQDDDSGGNFNALITYSVMADGYYYIVASQWLGSNGWYRLSVSSREMPTLTIGSDAAGVGDKVTVPVFVSGSPLLASLRFKLSYVDYAIKLIDVTLPDNSGFNVEVGSAPRELISLVPEGTAQVDPNGVLLYLNFEISNYAEAGDYYIDLYDLRAVDENDRNISFMQGNGFISVIYSGNIVTGKIKSYNPKLETIVQLLQNGDIKNETVVPGEPDRFGQEEQDFKFEGVAPGEYTLVINKKLHTTFTVKKITVSDEELRLTEDVRPEVALMTLRCGDINYDNMINDSDLTALWMPANYNKPAQYPADQRCDLNGDGYINDGDLTILWMAYNYNKGEVVVN